MNVPNYEITRRSMLLRTAQATAAATMTPGVSPLLAAPPALESPGYPIWDAHAHLTRAKGTPEEVMDQLLVYADRMGIDRVIFFMGFSRLHDPPPEQIRQDNDELMRAVNHAPDRALGFVYLNPKHVEESLQEMDRCIRDGPLVGVKLWVALRCNHKNLDPIVRRATELKAPVLQHVWSKITGNLPEESVPPDLAELAARHHQASFIAAHTGGNWEPGIRAIRSQKNVCAEISGSDPAAGMVEMAVRELGVERVIYGSDFGGRSIASQLAKVHGADVPETAKRMILGGNIRRLLQPILKAKGIQL